MLANRSHLRPYQFSVRTLLLVITLVCCLGGWVAYHRQQAADAQATIDAVEGLRGSIEPSYRPTHTTVFGDDS